MLVGTALTALLAACGGEEPAPVVGRPAPDFTVDSLEPEPLALQSFRGRPVVLNFFATWCGPCRDELPAFQAQAGKHAEAGLAVLLIDLQEDPDDVAVFLHELKIDLPTGIDRTGEVTKRYRVRGLPSTFFIDRQGVIRAVQMGALDERLLESGISKII